ncbi:acyl-CoA thioesterase domain-containing protein [Nocardioides marmoribigeumensis]|uniref:Thioesterase family protein n=1 Tax=Nocardioides marmoribigeumensis TaxID=433649 RepID=A0ABU2BQF5_9ACTN|nr:acyl-CoA thioesterase domain-containing protein [Nocardioides marmoribigeumensis]MDR7360877.1 hypothetical protein [Nocardioides marmoribigeumensis]
MSLSMFTADGDQLVPTDIARSMWSRDQMHGVAVSGALARALEQHLQGLGRDDLVPTRYRVDLFKAARMEPCTVTVEEVRQGPRLCLLDATLVQGEVRVARASCLFLLPTENPSGRAWEPSERTGPPPLDVVPVSDEPRVPFFASDSPWSQDFAAHQNAGRKRTWQAGLPVVEGERPTPFQVVAAVADATSMVVNWGTEGVQYINTDIDLAIARLPEGLEIGFAAFDRVEVDGLAVGSATVFDRRGPVGVASVTALANAKRPVDFEQVRYDDDGTRHAT